MVFIPHFAETEWLTKSGVNEASGEITWWVIQKFVPQNIYDVELVVDHDYNRDEDDTPVIEAY